MVETYIHEQHKADIIIGGALFTTTHTRHREHSVQTNVYSVLLWECVLGGGELGPSGSSRRRWKRILYTWCYILVYSCTRIGKKGGTGVKLSIKGGGKEFLWVTEVCEIILLRNSIRTSKVVVVAQ